jgi:prevent-host-death family protein
VNAWKRLDRLDRRWQIVLMKTATWELDEAKDHLREVVDNASQRGEQTLTEQGKPVAVVRAVESSNNPERGTGERFVALMRRCPAPEIFEIMERSRAEERARDLGLQ